VTAERLVLLPVETYRYSSLMCCCSRLSIWPMSCCDWGRSILQCATQTFTECCSCLQTVATHQSVLHCTVTSKAVSSYSFI